MEFQQGATPFGRRSMTVGMFKTQAGTETIAPDASVDKWKLFRALCEARPMLGVTDRALAVLNALFSFHPKPDLSAGEGMIVFPSNAQLSVRAHGMAATTLRRHLSNLVEAGLILRRDSPNGKRYARKDQTGEIGEAFGFCLSPLLARADEIRQLADAVIAERLQLKRLRERLSLCRRDVAKLIEAGIEEGLSGDWNALHLRYRALVAAVGRKAEAGDLGTCLGDMERLRNDVAKIFENNVNSTKTDGNADRNGRHIQNSNPQSIYESEPRFEKSDADSPLETKSLKQAEGADGWKRTERRREGQAAVRGSGRVGTDTRQEGRGSGDGGHVLPLGAVLRACPTMADYAPGGRIGAWRDLMTAAVTVRTMLGVSPSAYEEACDILGPENAATVIACILERANHITSPGGYLRSLTAKAKTGGFSLKPMVFALANANAGTNASSARPLA